MRTKGGLFLADNDIVSETENLEPAAIGQYRSVPAHEMVQPAEPLDGLLPRTQSQMVRIGEDHLCAVAHTWSMMRPLTVPCVPTGMNAGISTGPWGV